MDKQDRSDVEYCACVWCGNWISKDTYQKRLGRKLDDPNVCKDCRDTRKSVSLAKRYEKNWFHPTLGRIYCYLWSDELDEDWQPIDDEGNLYLPGVRICGLKDCVNSNHITATTKETDKG